MRIPIVLHRDISSLWDMPWLTDIPLLVNLRTRPPPLTLGSHLTPPVKCTFFCIFDRHEPENANVIVTLLLRHNGCNDASNHEPHDCLLNRSFRRRWKRTSKLRVTGLCAGNSPVTGEFPAPMASNAENVSIWCRHHEAWCLMMWTHFPHYCTFVEGFFRITVEYPDKEPEVWSFVSIFGCLSEEAVEQLSDFPEIPWYSYDIILMCACHGRIEFVYRYRYFFGEIQ